ncbi:MAG: hypothetical protein IMZ50_16430 [Candidatus Atribacteria bacterium]|nr:hypothetical protein [Candidatus Atribacteria bacterium]
MAYTELVRFIEEHVSVTATVVVDIPLSDAEMLDDGGVDVAMLKRAIQAVTAVDPCFDPDEAAAEYCERKALGDE